MDQDETRDQDRAASDPTDLVLLAQSADAGADWASSADLWGACLTQFPGHVDCAHWLEQRARALAETGRYEEAEKCCAALLEALPRQPQGYEALMRLANARKDWEALDEYSQRCIAAFPSHPNLPSWLEQRGYALLDAGQYERAGEPFETLISVSPLAHQGYAGLAWRAERQWQWRSAAAHWDKCAAVACGESRNQALVRKGYCLIEIGEIDAARLCFNAIGDRIDALEGLAQLATLQETPDIAGQAWDECCARFSDSPAGFLGKGELLLAREAFAEAEGLAQYIQRSWPGSVAAGILSARCAANAKRWQVAGERWKGMLATCPDNPDVRAGYVRYLAALGDQGALDVYFSGFVADRATLAACILEYHLARDDLGAAVEQAHTLAELEKEKPGHRLRLAILLMREGSSGALHAALWILRELHQHCPDSIAIRVQLAEALIRSRLDLAKDLIRVIPADDRRDEVQTLRAWLLYEEGDNAAAKQNWEASLARRFVPAIHAAIGGLRRIDGNQSNVRSGEILLFSTLRNEQARLAWFLGYYRKLGVDRFVIVDNASTDDSAKTLLQEPDVILYQTADRYSAAGAGMRWINELIERHGRSNWCLHVDLDEALVFPEHETVGFRGLVDYLNWTGREAMLAFMLDMFPATAPQPTSAQVDWLEKYVYFDRDTETFGSSFCPYREVLGGARRRLFNGYQILNKVPLINGASGIKYLLSSHRITPAKLSDISGALLHYHLVYILESTFRPLLDDAILRREFPSNALERLRSRELLPNISAGMSLLGKESVRFESVDQLRRLGIVQTNSQFAEFCESAAIARSSLQGLD
jgi:tetratricopeptide (TPR) repeat protein